MVARMVVLPPTLFRLDALEGAGFAVVAVVQHRRPNPVSLSGYEQLRWSIVTREKKLKKEKKEIYILSSGLPYSTTPSKPPFEHGCTWFLDSKASKGGSDWDWIRGVQVRGKSDIYLLETLMGCYAPRPLPSPPTIGHSACPARIAAAALATSLTTSAFSMLSKKRKGTQW